MREGAQTSGNDNTTAAHQEVRQASSEDENPRLSESLLSKLEDLSVNNNPTEDRPHHPAGPSSTPPIFPEPRAATPQQQHLSPAALAQLRGTPTGRASSVSGGSSPPVSQVSVGSVGPNLVSSLIGASPGAVRHYDLTPVTRNTTSEGAAQQAIVSPEDSTSGFLHGEHLALPADLSDDAYFTGPAIPALRSGPMQRAQSVGTTLEGHSILQADFARVAHGFVDASGAFMKGNDEGGAATRREDFPLPAPVQFPSRKFYSFTSRQQYEEALQQEHERQGTMGGGEGLTPYQPTRDHDFAEIGTPGDEALQNIFIARRDRRPPSQNNSSTSTSSSGESHNNHRLQNPIPLEDRQWSDIPSIRMASRLSYGDGSVTSYTAEEDDESLLYDREGRPLNGLAVCTDEDDLSLSSRASSLGVGVGISLEALRSQGIFAAGMGSGGAASGSVPANMVANLPSSDVILQCSSTASSELADQESPTVLMDTSALHRDQDHRRRHLQGSSPAQGEHGGDQEEDTDLSAIAVDGDRQTARRKRKQRKREQKAYAWLQSLEARGQEVAEAASSKFLTAGGSFAATGARTTSMAEATVSTAPVPADSNNTESGTSTTTRLAPTAAGDATAFPLPPNNTMDRKLPLLRRQASSPPIVYESGDPTPKLSHADGK